MQDPGTTPPHQSNQSTSSEPPSWQNPPQQGYSQQNYTPMPNPSGQAPQQSGSNNKIAAGLCGILLGAFGVHKFVLGYTNEGLIMLLVSLLGGVVTCGTSTGIISLIGLIEGIIYLTKSDQDFMQTYVYNKKPWF